MIATLGLTKGGMVEAGAIVMTLEGPETLAQAETAKIALAQRTSELAVAEKLFAGGGDDRYRGHRAVVGHRLWPDLCHHPDPDPVAADAGHHG